MLHCLPPFAEQEANDDDSVRSAPIEAFFRDGDVKNPRTRSRPRGGRRPEDSPRCGSRSGPEVGMLAIRSTLAVLCMRPVFRGSRRAKMHSCGAHILAQPTRMHLRMPDPSPAERCLITSPAALCEAVRLQAGFGGQWVGPGSMKPHG